MKLAFFLCFKNWTYRRVRTVCSALGIAVGVALIVAILVVDRNSVLHKQDKERRKFGDPDAVVTLAPADVARAGEVVQEVSRVAGVRAVLPVATAEREVVLADGSGHRVLHATVPLEGLSRFRLAHTMLGAELGPTRMATGRPVWIPQALAKRLELEVGARLELDGAPVEVVGLLRDQYLAFGRDLVLSLWEDTPLDTTADVQLWLRIAPRDEVRAVLGRLTAGGLAASLAPAAQIILTAEDIAMRNGLKICAVMGLALGLFTVLHTLWMSVSERRREIALLHALGATRRQIGQGLLLDATLQALVGTAGGFALGLLLAWVMSRLGISSMGADRFPVVEVPWGSLLGVAAAGFALTLCGALYPWLLARRVPTAQVLVPRGLELDGAGARRVPWILPLVLAVALVLMQRLVAWLTDAEAAPLAAFAMRIAALLAFAMSLVFVAPGILRGVALLSGRLWKALRGPRYYLAYRNVATTGHRNATAVVALMLVFAAIFCMHTLTESMKDEIRRWADLAIDDRLFVQHGRGRTADERTALAGEPGVLAIEAIENEVRLPEVVRGMDPAGLSRLSLSDEERAALAALGRGEGVIVTRPFADQHGLRAGGALTLATRTGPRPFPVLLVSDRFGYRRPERAYALMQPELLARQFGAVIGSIRFSIVHFEAAGDPDAVARRHAAWVSLYGTQFAPGPWLARNRVWNIDKDFVVFDVILLGAVVLAGIGMLNSLLIQAVERRREVALYRALGMTGPELITLLTAEGLVLGSTGAILALLLGLPASFVAFQALRQVSGLDLHFTPPLGWAIACGVLCLAIAWLASRHPARFLAREDVAASLRYC